MNANKKLYKKDYENSWGKSQKITKNVQPDSFFCSESTIAMYQIAAYNDQVKKYVIENKDTILTELGATNAKRTIHFNTKEFNNIVKDIAKAIPRESIEKNRTLDLHAKNTSPQHLSSRLDEWSLVHQITGWKYVGTYNQSQDKKRREQKDIELPQVQSNPKQGKTSGKLNQ